MDSSYPVDNFIQPSYDRAQDYWFWSGDHNTKRAKLSIDVCAVFVAAKAIFSNFAIARATAQTIESDF